MSKQKKRLKDIFVTLAVFALGNWQASESIALTFVVTSDNHSGYSSSQKALWLAIAPHRGAFAMTAGDVGSPGGIRKVIDECVGTTYPWYAAVGNHDLRKDRMTAFRALNADGNSLPNIVNPGPANCKETTYSFRYENCHFVILNQYYDGNSDIGYKTEGSNGQAYISDAQYNWLESDLDAARADPKIQHIFVTAHEPLYYVTDHDSPLKIDLFNDYDLGRDCQNRDRFWNLLKRKDVLAFFCGHHHQFRVHRMDENDVWQVLSAWGRGCDPPNASDRWKHVKCTFVKVNVTGGTVTYEAYRGPAYGGPCEVPYTVGDSGTLVDGKGVQPSASEMTISRADDNTDEMVFPGEQWQERTPESQGIDSAKLHTTLNYLESRCGKDGIHEVVIIRNGYMIYQGDRAENRRSTASVGKVFASTVLGLLIDEGECTLDTLACDYDPLLKKHYPGVRLRHFATMTSGYDAEGHHQRHVNVAGDGKGDWGPNACAVALPLFAPGEKYLYYDEAMFMFGRVLTAVVREPIKEYLTRRVCDPIGMGDWVWNSDRLVQPINGISVNWGCGNVHVNAKQLARLGHLYLNQGRWRSRQLISRKWVTQATRNQVLTSIGLEMDSRKVDGRGVYGYHWWTQGTSPTKGENLPDAPEGTFYRTGAGRNILFVVPKWNMVIVRLGNDSSSDDWMSTWNEVFKKLGASFIQD